MSATSPTTIALRGLVIETNATLVVEGAATLVAGMKYLL
jgi:hypothetical protein